MKVWFVLAVGAIAMAIPMPAQADSCRYTCRTGETRDGRGCCIAKPGRNKSPRKVRPRPRLRHLAAPSGNSALVHINKTAERFALRGKYKQCGRAYQQAYKLAPKAKEAAQLLYNSGICFHRARQLGYALSSFATIGRQFVKSPFAAHALLRSGQVYAQVGWYDKAADALEQYARRWPGAKDARDGLADAIQFRAGIGDRAKAIAASRLFDKTYRRHAPAQTAAVMFALTAMYAGRNNERALEKHLNRYLRTHGRRGGIDRRIVAHAQLGQLLWKRACPVTGVNGLCISVTRKRSELAMTKKRRHRASRHSRQCGPASKLHIVARTRTGRLTTQAMRHFRRAVALWKSNQAKRNIDDNDRLQAMNYWAAAARFYASDRMLETFIDIRFPIGLDFFRGNMKRAKNSYGKWIQWYQRKGRLMKKLERQYRSIKQFNSPEWETAATARIGQMVQSYTDVLYTTPISPALGRGRYGGRRVAAFCNTLNGLATPIEKVTVRAYASCLATGARHKIDNRWTTMCAAELGQLKPSTYPTSSEIRPLAMFPGEFFGKPVSGDEARWKAELRRNDLLLKPRLKLAWGYLSTLTLVPNTPQRRRVVSEIRQRLSSVLAADETNIKAYALYALLYMVDSKPNPAQLTLAKLFLDRGIRQPGNHADIWNLRGRLAVMKGQMATAHRAFGRAVALNANHVDATLNLGLVKLAMRDHKGARTYFRRALKVQPQRYDAHIGLGIALRMRSNYAGAEKAYKNAVQAAPKLGDAYYNLGVLYKEFYARRRSPAQALAAIRSARSWFQRAVAKKLTAEHRQAANADIHDCDRAIARLLSIKALQRRMKTP